jgi:hypothetical protein
VSSKQKRADGGAPIDGVIALSAFPSHSNRSMPNVPKNKTLRDGAKQRTGAHKPKKKHKR